MKKLSFLLSSLFLLANSSLQAIQLEIAHPSMFLDINDLVDIKIPDKETAKKIGVVFDLDSFESIGGGDVIAIPRQDGTYVLGGVMLLTSAGNLRVAWANDMTKVLKKESFANLGRLPSATWKKAKEN